MSEGCTVPHWLSGGMLKYLLGCKINRQVLCFISFEYEEFLVILIENRSEVGGVVKIVSFLKNGGICWLMFFW